MKDMEFKPELGNIHRHYWLLRSVAEATGVDIREAMHDGRLSQMEFAKLLTGCRGAGCGKACALWLSTQKDQTGRPPEFCQGRDVLEKLKD